VSQSSSSGSSNPSGPSSPDGAAGPSGAAAPGSAAIGPAADEAKRLFVGLRVSVQTANGLAGAVETLARRAGQAGIAVRWLSPTLYHITLKFLGWTRPEATSALRDGLREAVRGVEPFSFTTARLGAFPNVDQARVVWAGVTSREDLLGQLARRVDEATAPLGFLSDHPFVAHVTLGRLGAPTAMNDVLLPLMEQVFSDSKVNGISLLESTLKSGALAYREIAHFGFSPASGPSESARKRQSPPLQLAPHSAPSSSDKASPSSELSMHDIETDDGWPRGHGP
jgi:2'-5' RNA ligase